MMIGLLHQLPSRRTGEVGQVPGCVVFRRTHVEAIDGAPRRIQCGHVAHRDSAHARTIGDGTGPSARDVQGSVAHHGRGPAIGPALECLTGERPADGAVAQRRHRIRQTGVHERLRADDAACASGAIDDHTRGRVRGEFAHAQHEFGTGHAGRAGNVHGLVFVEPARVDDDHIGARIEQCLNFLRGQRRGMPQPFDPLAKGFARHVDVAKDFSASRDPTVEAARETIDVGVAELAQHAGSARRQILAAMLAVDDDARVAARYARPDVDLHARERKVRRPQWVRLREWIFFANVEQRNFLTGEQRGTHVGIGQFGESEVFSNGSRRSRLRRRIGRERGHGGSLNSASVDSICVSARWARAFAQPESYCGRRRPNAWRGPSARCGAFLYGFGDCALAYPEMKLLRSPASVNTLRRTVPMFAPYTWMLTETRSA